VTCVSTLEHIRDHGRAVRMMFSLLSPASLVLTFPYNEKTYVDNVYALPVHRADNIRLPLRFFPGAKSTNGGRERGHLIAQEYWRYFDGPFWTIERALSRRVRESDDLHQISCIALIKGS